MVVKPHATTHTALWGIHDRQLILRKQLYDMLTEGVDCGDGADAAAGGGAGGSGGGGGSSSRSCGGGERGRLMVEAFKRRWRCNQEAVNKQVPLRHFSKPLHAFHNFMTRLFGHH